METNNTHTAEELLRNSIAAELEYLDSIQEKIAKMTAEDQQKWAAYRAVVESITSQVGFPDTYHWPHSPNHHSFTSFTVERI